MFQPHPIAWGQPPTQMANMYVTDCWSRSQLPPLQYRLALPCRMRVSLPWVMLGQVQLRAGRSPARERLGFTRHLGPQIRYCCPLRLGKELSDGWREKAEESTSFPLLDSGQVVAPSC